MGAGWLVGPPLLSLCLEEAFHSGRAGLGAREEQPSSVEVLFASHCGGDAGPILSQLSSSRGGDPGARGHRPVARKCQSGLGTWTSIWESGQCRGGWSPYFVDFGQLWMVSVWIELQFLLRVEAK